MAGQDVDDVRGAEALATLRDRRQDDARLRRTVGAWHLVEAVVAIAARLRLLAEIAEQHLAPALRRLAIADQGVEPLVRSFLVLGRCVLVVDEQPPHAERQTLIELVAVHLVHLRRDGPTLAFAALGI